MPTPPPVQTGQVLELLDQARLRVSSARDHLDSLNTGVAEASRALARAELQNAAHEAPASQPQPRTPAEEMGVVQQRCHGAADVGITIAGELNQAAGLVRGACDTIRDVSRDGLSTQEGSDLAALRVWLDTLGDILERARPMATAASEYLYDAAFVASKSGHASSAERDPQPRFDATTSGKDLDRAAQNSQQLGRTIEQAGVTGRQAAGHADRVNEAAEMRAVQQSTAGPGLLTDSPATDVTEGHHSRLGVENLDPTGAWFPVGPDGAWSDQTRTVWSDASWLSTAQCLPTQEFETVFFAPDPARQTWRKFRVIAANREDAMHNHRLIERVIAQDNQQAARRAKPASQDADRCPTRAAAPSRLPWKRPALSIPPWIETSRLMSAVARVGFTQPWAHPSRNEIRYRDPLSTDTTPSGLSALGSQPETRPMPPASPSEVRDGQAEQVPARHIADSLPQPDPRAGSPLPEQHRDPFSEGAHHRLSTQSRVQSARSPSSAPPVPGR